MTDNLPDNGGYVAAAYLVFLALVLVYVVILGIRLSRLHQDVADLDELSAQREGERDRERAPA